MARWSRDNKATLAAEIAALLELGFKPGVIARAIGKSTERIRQIRKLFGLSEWRRAR